MSRYADRQIIVGVITFYKSSNSTNTPNGTSVSAMYSSVIVMLSPIPHLQSEWICIHLLWWSISLGQTLRYDNVCATKWYGCPTWNNKTDISQSNLIRSLFCSRIICQWHYRIVIKEHTHLFRGSVKCQLFTSVHNIHFCRT